MRVTAYVDGATGRLMRRVEELDPATAIRLLADHIGVDLDVLAIVDSSTFRSGWCLDEADVQVADELDDLRDCIDRGEPLPQACDARAKTLRRIVTAEQSRESVR